MKKALIILLIVAGVLLAEKVDVINSTTNVRTPTTATGTGAPVLAASPVLTGTPTVAAVINSTFDSQATGNILKFLDEIHLTNPHQVEGATVVIDPVSSSATYGHAIFSGTEDKASNYVLYRFRVPFDLDTSAAMSASFVFRMGGADVSTTQNYEISMSDVADSASADLPTFSNAIALTFAGDAAGASGDIQTIAYTTLTGWAAALTPGHIIVIKLARDGDTSDTSTVSSTDVELSIKYGRTQ